MPSSDIPAIMPPSLVSFFDGNAVPNPSGNFMDCRPMPIAGSEGVSPDPKDSSALESVNLSTEPEENFPRVDLTPIQFPQSPETPAPVEKVKPKTTTSARSMRTS